MKADLKQNTPVSKIVSTAENPMRKPRFYQEHPMKMKKIPSKMAQGKSVVHLHNSDLEKIDLPYPSYDEQRRISGFFSNLDNLITLHQRKLEQMKNYKVGLLQQMFV